MAQILDPQTRRERYALGQTVSVRVAPRPPLGPEILRRAWVALAVLAVGAAAGFAYGSSRPLTFTAQAQLVAGPTVSSPQSLSGNVDAASGLAGSYARLGNTASVLRAAARALGVSQESLDATVNVGAVEGNPTVRVTAVAPDTDTAKRYAGSVARTLRRLVARQISPERLGRSQLDEYTAATRAVNEAKAALTRLRTQRSDDPTSVSRAQIDKLLARYDSAQLRQQTAASIYSAGRQNAQAIVGLSAFDSPRIVATNRNDQRLRWAVTGAAAGLAVGALVVLALAALARRRLGRR